MAASIAFRSPCVNIQLFLNIGNGLHTVQSEIKGGEGLDLTPYDPKPGTEKTSPIDSTPVGQGTNGAGEKHKALHKAKEKEAAESATVEV